MQEHEQNQIQPKRKPGRPKATTSQTPTMNLILRTAAFQFMEHGYEKVSLEGVAQACGVTKASVYYYFNNKAMLFTESLIFVLGFALEQTRKLIMGPGTLQERLILIAERHMSNTHVDFETMMREASSGLSEEQIIKIRSAESELHQLLAEVFQQAIDDNEIAAGEPMLMAHAYTALLTVRNRNEVVKDEATLKRSVESIMSFFWNGLAPRQ
ncbi:MAG: TetR/AcrR family transcriptional regulator [Candidatus Pristimantibacillus sp.]